MDNLVSISEQLKMGGSAAGLPHELLSGLNGMQLQDLKQQANTLWKMLDDMAETNPDQYADFIKQQASAAAAASQQAGTNHMPHDPAARVVAGQQAECGHGSSSRLLLQPAHQRPVVIHVWAAPGDTVPMTGMSGESSGRASAGNTILPIAVATAVPPAAWQPPSSLTNVLGRPASHYHCAVHTQVLLLAAAAGGGAAHEAEACELLHEAACQWAEATHHIKLLHTPRTLQFNRKLLIKSSLLQPQSAASQDINLSRPAPSSGVSLPTTCVAAPPAGKQHPKRDTPLIQELS